MVTPGIVDTGVYIPRYRLGSRELSGQWGRFMGRGERAVANHDEDAITMAVAAASRCLGDRSPADIDALFFASTTASYREKQCASTVSAALDLGHLARTQDFSGSLRAGTGAMFAALDALRANTATSVLVVAADCRVPEPGGPLESRLGDGAAAVLIGNMDVAAELVGHISISEDFTDTWRRDQDLFVKSGDSRFGKSHGYVKNTKEAITAMVDCAGCSLDDVTRYAVYSPDGRSHMDIAKKMGLDMTAMQDPMAKKIGMIGCAHPLLMLAGAVEASKPGQKIMVTSYAEGSDAFVFQTTESVTGLSARGRAAKAIDGGVELGSYTKYLTFKKLIKEDGPGMTPFSSTILSNRELNLIVRHHGRKCNKCDIINTLGLRVCPKCGAKDEFIEIPLAKKGVLHTYTQEHYFPNPDGPVTMAVVDLKDGARFLSQMTDVDAKDVKIGMELEMTFRRLHEGGGFHNYCWKCMPSTSPKGGG